MKPEIYKEVKEKFEKVKRSLPYLELKIKTRNKKEIEDSVAYLVYLLHRVHKQVMEVDSSASIQELHNRLWWFRNQKVDDERKFVDVNKLYQSWARKYDVDNNLLIFLEEKVSKEFFGDVDSKMVLDLGCGTGRYSIPLARSGAEVTSIDFTNAMLKRAREKAKKSNLDVTFKKFDISKYKSDKKFDLIISMLVLEHVKNLEKVISVINKASKIGTNVVISNIHPEMLRKDVDEKGKAKGWILSGKKTNQYYHPLEKYVDLFFEKGFVLTKVKNLVYEKKYQGFRKFKKFAGLKDKSIGIIMRFEKIK